MGPQADTTTEPLDQAVCVTCGYDLGGHDPDGRCPECGTPTARSLRGQHLRDADVDWLRSLHRGQWLLAWGVTLIAGSIVTFLGFLFLTGILAAASVSNGPGGSLVMWAGLVMGYIVVAGMLIAMVGTFMVTCQDPRDVGRERLLSPRNRARGGFVGMLASVLIIEAIGYALTGTGRTAMTWVSIVLVSMLFLIAITAILDLLAGLAIRATAHELATQGHAHRRRLLWLGPVAMVLQVGGMSVPGGGTSILVSGVRLLAVCGSFLVTILIFAEAIRLTIFLHRCRQCLSAVYEDARLRHIIEDEQGTAPPDAASS